jgi:hypothetical protein
VHPVRLLIAALAFAAACSTQALGSAPAPLKCKLDVPALKRAQLDGRAAVRVQTTATCPNKSLRTLDIKLVYEFASGEKVTRGYSLSGGRMKVYRYDGRSLCPAADLPVDGAGNKPSKWWVRARLAKGLKRPYPRSGGPLIAKKNGPKRTIASICPSSLEA